MIKNIKWLLLVSLTFVACDNNDDEVVAEVAVTAGSANFSKYVALGNSLTAGFSDNALFIKGQQGSYTNIMAQQFKLAGGGEFKIPLMNDNVGGLLFGGVANPRFGKRLYLAGFTPITPTTSAAPILLQPAGASTTEVFAPNTGGPYNNVGVPGAKSFHLLSPSYGSSAGLSTGTANPYYVRFAPNATTSVLAYAMSQTPTFFSLWIGNNDVLGYATAGGVTSAQDPVNGSDITPVTGAAGVGFDGTYTALVNTLTSAGAKGVIANIPYVNTVPFFTTVGYNPATLSAAQVAALNSAYAAYNGGLVAAKNLGLINEAERVQRTINFVVGKNPVVMVDEYLTDITAVSPALVKLRQTTSADYIVLSSQGTPAQVHLGAGNGTSAPLQDRWVLSKAEVAELKTATDAYNLTIKSLADSKGLAFVDANALLSLVATGTVRFGNYSITSSFLTGGAFSLDGVHPSARGYALIANKFLEAINAKYGSTFRPVDLGLYPIQYPAVIN